MGTSKIMRVVGFAVVFLHPCESLRTTYYDGPVGDGMDDLRATGDEKGKSPHETLPEGVLVTARHARTKERYREIVKDMKGLMDKLSSSCNKTNCDDGEFAGCVLRAAGHDFMDFKNGKGGPDGCWDWKDPDNKGLQGCLFEGDVNLVGVWEKHRRDVSLADFLVIAAEAAMVRQRGNLKPGLEFEDNFRFGRVTNPDCSGQGELPQPREGCEAVKEVFGKQLGLSNRGIAAMMGVHTLGRARLQNSGYDGWWSDPHNSRVFNNNFYISMLLKGWAPEQTKNKQFQWGRVGARQGENKKTKEHPEMMLNTDICLAYGDHAEFAHKQKCCAWIMPEVFPEDGAGQVMKSLKKQEKSEKEKFCGFNFDPKKILQAPFEDVRKWCCEMTKKKGPAKDCGDPRKLEGFAAEHVVDFAEDEGAWLYEFQKAWKTATEKSLGSWLGSFR